MRAVTQTLSAADWATDCHRLGLRVHVSVVPCDSWPKSPRGRGEWDLMETPVPAVTALGSHAHAFRARMRDRRPAIDRLSSRWWKRGVSTSRRCTSAVPTQQLHTCLPSDASNCGVRLQPITPMLQCAMWGATVGATTACGLLSHKCRRCSSCNWGNLHTRAPRKGGGGAVP